MSNMQSGVSGMLRMLDEVGRGNEIYTLYRHLLFQ